MKKTNLLALAAALSLSSAVLAQAPPAGSTGICKDGTYSQAASKSGACRGHKGVKEWYAATAATSAATSAKSATTAASAAAPKAAAAAAAAPAQASSAGNTGICKDGTYSQAASKSGACRGHQGVKEWYAASGTTATKSATPSAVTTPAPQAAPAAAAAPAPAPKAAPAAAAASATASTKVSPSARAASMTQAAGGGPGLVWVNSESNVYHCAGTTFYGKTKKGQYMSEADAKSKGAHADHNHACTN